MNGRLEEAERDGLVGAENANEKEKGKYKIHKLQNTKYKVKRMWRRTESRGGEGGGRWRYCDSDDRYYAQGGEGKGW